VTRHKLVIPTKGIMILVFWEKRFKSKEAASQDLFLHLAKEFLLLPKYVVIRLSRLTRDASSWKLLSWKSQEYDTTKRNHSMENLPPGKLQGDDVQNGPDESNGVLGLGSRDFSCHSQVLF